MKNLRTGGDVAHGIAVLVHCDVAALAEDDHVGRLAGAAATHLQHEYLYLGLYACQKQRQKGIEASNQLRPTSRFST